jgi:hypothetical protein
MLASEQTILTDSCKLKRAIQESNMSSELVETGWQRFLQRLKQLWGKSRNSDLPAAATSTAIPEGMGVTFTTAEAPALKSGAGLIEDQGAGPSGKSQVS